MQGLAEDWKFLYGGHFIFHFLYSSMISFIVVFTLGIAQAFYGSTGILQFITLYLGSFFLQQDGWLKKAENQHFNF